MVSRRHSDEGSGLIHSEHSSPRRRCSCGRCIIPFFIFLSFFLNFIASDVGHASDSLLTILTPPGYSFLIWLVIYVLQFVFVLYQLFAPKPRNSTLIQKYLGLPYIFHQILTAIWLVLFSRQKIYEATAIITVIWILALLMFCLITVDFRSNSYEHYSTVDYYLIEVPFAVLLGWETLATLISWNILIVKLAVTGVIGAEVSQSIQVAAAIITLALIAVATILFSGLPMIMDPFVHVPIVWGLFGIGWRWTQMQSEALLPAHLSWALPTIRQGFGYAAWFVAGIGIVFCVVAGVILCFSTACEPDDEGHTRSSECISEEEMTSRPRLQSSSVLNATDP